VTNLRVEGVHFRLARGVDPERASPLLRRAVELLAEGGAENEKSGRRKELYRLALEGSESPDHLVKVNRYFGLDGWRGRLRGSKSSRELSCAEAVASRGIATPLPLAAGEARVRGRLRACYLVVPLVRGARDLRRVFAEPPRARERRALGAAFGSFARRIHDAGIYQDDFAPNNFLLGPAGAADLQMIDFERAALRRSNDRTARRFMLAKLDRELVGASLADRERFLHAYCSGDREASRRLWRELEGEAARLAERDLARLGRVTTRKGRRFAPFTAGPWSGFRRTEVPAGALREALERVGSAPSRRPSAGVFLRDGGDSWGVDAETGGPVEDARLWACGVLLARRGLGPVPLSLARRGSRALLLFGGPAPATLDALSGPAERRAAHPGLTLFLDRLLSLGSLRAPLAPELLSWDPARGRAALLWPGALHLGGRGTSDRHAESRRLAVSLLSLEG
jgi:tRNA A-37 threonylcarbamoyl transferase component Bud32